MAITPIASAIDHRECGYKPGSLHISQTAADIFM